MLSILLASSLTTLVLAGGTGDEVTSRSSSLAPIDAHASAWTWRFVPYLFAANLDGTLSVGPTEVDADVSFSDILQNLDFGAFVLLEGHHERFGFALDGAYIDLTEDGKGAGQSEAELETTLLSLAGLYRLTQTSPVELALGLRYLDADQELTVGPTTVDGESQVLDVFTGARATWPMAERWRLSLLGDIGTGGSDLTWQAVANVGYDFERWGVNLGYRVLSYDIEDGSKELDIALEGWQFGLEYRF